MWGKESMSETPKEADAPDGLDMPGLTPKRTKADAPRPEGPGPCPKCGGPTRFIPDSRRGPFHGCLAYPVCKGTRGADPDEATEKTLYADAWKTNRRMPKELEAP
jgi:ssDNA-binding Zn-finger/Zn-ribbon topoisomerase 1